MCFMGEQLSVLLAQATCYINEEGILVITSCVKLRTVYRHTVTLLITPWVKIKM